MSKKHAAYNAIGERYEQFIEDTPQREIDVRTILSMVGDVSGKSVLDVACGYGYFGRELRKRGASKVVGVDISEAMIEHAREKSEQHNDDIEFHVQDVCHMESLGKFDIIVAAWLFNYAESIDDLEKMFQVVASHLKLSGKLVAYTVSPAFRFNQGNYDIYGINILSEEPCKGGAYYHVEFLTTPPSLLIFYRWNHEDYERAIQKAGFSRVEWQKPKLLENDFKRYPEGFWDIFQRNNLNIGFTCQF
ncbi:class I SAM-dependent methyltransferase [Xenorhabdus sp. XENO-7]|uniref:Class I SAM-dependent methyltransferase n=1 Tax=Xenorhabdus aichiensis TaxID=3025874 RepID=A0ABT5M2B0_9GAMM|nr:class I SAM-dependent methyltransferase [Xenorhabdus aichiensis]MDC9621115.1 class I SAM-dependent methyltransferase [Xenorhabdus aichiensis]